jgi:hypothetical protein
LHAEARGKEIQAHFTQRDLAAQAFLELGLDDAAIAVHVKSGDKDHSSADH